MASLATVPRIRDARPGDALPVARVHVRSWQAAYRGLIEDDFLDRLRPEDRAASYAFGAEDPAAPRTIVAEAEGEIWGFATAGPCRDEDAPAVAELYALYVDPDRWRGGAGRLLLDAATARMREAGFEDAVLWVLRGNRAAERFYAGAGWRRDGGERTEQPYGVVSRVVRMRRSLQR
jgi:GNAT superfamily N-acetyltransferase